MFSLCPYALGVLAFALLLSGLDDFLPLLICLWARCSQRTPRVHEPTDSPSADERRIAIFVPCWRESAVIGNMVRHNLAALRYRNFNFILGVYPNDSATVKAAESLAAEFANVHVACCPHPGPTSKADCLNWAYHRMTALESERGWHFDTVVLHDAEDLIHPLALSLIDRQRRHYAMVQVPVLPLPTGFGDVTHGVYCDEFSEFQTIDMRARQASRSFIPSNGVGTGFARSVLDQLAATHQGDRQGQVFDPASLTEDYEIGVRIHALGHRQCFAPLTPSTHGFIATREYFPRTLQTAIRQRTRWITGIALQCWERQGWRGDWRTKYWFWRDRKGLLTNPLSAVANVSFVLGLFDYLLSTVQHRPWLFEIRNPAVAKLCLLTTALGLLRLTLRAICVGRLFGVAAALAVPLRSFHANLINCCAAIRALYGYLAAKRQKKTVAWQKTDHAYPQRELLEVHRRDLSEVLVGCGFASGQQIEEAQAELDTGLTLDVILMTQGIVNEEQLCKAISVQSGIATARVDPFELQSRAIRTLPARIGARHSVIPIGIESGRLLVATAHAPSTAAISEIGAYSSLPVDFQLVTSSTYTKLCKRLTE